MQNPLAHLIPQTANSTAIQVNNSVSDNPLAHLIPSAQSQMPESSFGEKALVGLGHGMLRAGQGVKQLGLLAGEKLGLVPEGRASEYTREVDQDEQLYNRTPVGQSTTGAISSFVGGALPYAVVPGGVAGNLARRIATGAASGAAIGATSYVPEAGSRALNTVIGGTLGSAFPLAATGIKQGYDFVRSPSNTLAKDVLRGVDPNVAEKTVKSAHRLDDNFWITPAEASGSPIAAAKQGSLGTSKPGAQQLFEKGKERLATEKQIVSGVLNDVSPDNTIASGQIRDIAKNIQSGRENIILNADQAKMQNFLTGLASTNKDVAGDVRSAAQQIINKKVRDLEAKAQPLYKTAYSKKVAPNKIKSLMEADGTIENSINGVLNDPKYRFELQGYAPNSIKVLDLAKRRIDAQIEAAKGTIAQPGDKDAVRVLTASKERLVSAIDKFNRTYARARTIYGEGAKPIEQLRNSNIGKLADLDDAQLKNVSKIIFDPNQTNINVLADLRDQISKQNPDLWKNLVRNEMERRLDKASTDRTGELFINKLLGNEQDFKQFYEATKGFQDLRSQLVNLKSQFNNSAQQLKQLRSTDISRLANLDDTQLKNVSKIIFDPSQTNINALSQLRKEISSKNPDAWRRIVRNELERRLDKAGDYAGSSFYDKVLKSNNSFRQFMEATRGMPDVRQKLVDMRRSFKNLIEPVSTKTAARLAKSSLDVPRSTYEAALNAVKNLLGGKYDQAAIKLITSNKWDKEFSAINRIPTQSASLRAEKLGALLGKISAAQVAKTDYPD